MSTSIVNTINNNIINKNVVEYAEKFKGYAVELHPNLTRDLHRILTHPI
jgi:hypothetical protein